MSQNPQNDFNSVIASSEISRLLERAEISIRERFEVMKSIGTPSSYFDFTYIFFSDKLLLTSICQSDPSIQKECFLFLVGCLLNCGRIYLVFLFDPNVYGRNCIDNFKTLLIAVFEKEPTILDLIIPKVARKDNGQLVLLILQLLVEYVKNTRHMNQSNNINIIVQTVENYVAYIKKNCSEIVWNKICSLVAQLSSLLSQYDSLKKTVDNFLLKHSDFNAPCESQIVNKSSYGYAKLAIISGTFSIISATVFGIFELKNPLSLGIKIGLAIGILLVVVSFIYFIIKHCLTTNLNNQYTETPQLQ
jgi:hypothetical protein